MFGFLKDMSLASYGVDMEAVNTYRAEKCELRKNGKYIFSVKAKVSVCILSALYILMTVFTLASRGRFTFDSALDVLFIIVSLFIVICLWAFGKKGEVISVCGIAGLLAGLYIRVIV